MPEYSGGNPVWRTDRLISMTATLESDVLKYEQSKTMPRGRLDLTFEKEMWTRGKTSDFGRGGENGPMLSVG